MNDLPSFVEIHEEGPRDGLQIEKTYIPTNRKLQFIEALSETGLREVQITSFVRPDLVPQMADAEEVASRFTPKPGVRYTALYLNEKGLLRVLGTQKFHIKGRLSLTASEAFCKRNINKTIQENIAMLPNWIQIFQDNNVPIEGGGIMAAFGCNFEGDIPLERVMGLVEVFEDLSKGYDFPLQEVSLADTMGWANPEQIKRVVGAARARWPEVHFTLHLHDTRGTGLANVYAGLQMGIDAFDACVGGLGGCPFAGHAGASGNVCSEDIVFMCQEMAIETGIDLDQLIDCAKLAEGLVGHPLPGKVMKGGNLRKYREAAALARNA
ncbi:MAG: hydroxymethylglutaryl-CoA lyase [Candidatus Entotheonellia bacterium]